MLNVEVEISQEPEEYQTQTRMSQDKEFHGKQAAEGSGLHEQLINEDESSTEHLKQTSNDDQGAIKDQTEASLNNRRLLVTEKGSLKWLSDYEELCHVIERLQLQPGKWTTPRGQCKQFENNDVIICWYAKSGTLTLKGSKADEIKEKILYFDCTPSDKVITDSDSTKFNNLHSTLKPQASNLHNVSQNSILIDEIRELKSSMETFTNSVYRKLEVINNEISDIKDFKTYTEFTIEATVMDLNKERLDLSNKHENLRKENKDLCQELSELRAKVLDLQDEKSSLLTAMKLIQRDGKEEFELNKKKIEALENENNKLRQENRGFSKVTRRNKKMDINHTPKTPASLQVQNQYEVLSSEQEDDTESGDSNAKSARLLLESNRDHQNTISKDLNCDNECENSIETSIMNAKLSSHTQEANADTIAPQDTHLHSKRTSAQPKSPISNPSSSSSKDTNKSTRENVILLIGDSIIKHIEPKKISRRKTIKHIYPGKTAEEIRSEMEAIEVEATPSHIIVHAGTNDLPLLAPHLCAKNIENLALSLNRKFTDSKIGISSITARNDLDLNQCVTMVNEEVQRMCSRNGFDFIDNGNIDASCLNGSLLHLNAKGSAFLATNFIKFLRGSNPSAPMNRQRKRNADFQTRRLYQDHPLEELLRLLLSQRRY